METAQGKDFNTSGSFDHICKALFASAAEGLIIAGSDGKIVMMNQRAEDMFGYEASELVGARISQLVPGPLREQHEHNTLRYMAKPSRRTMGNGLDLIALRKDGTTFPVEISLNHLTLDGEGYAMALISDITLRKSAEMELANLNEDLERRVQERTRELRDSQQLYTVIARNFPNGTINVFDRDFNYVFADGRELFRLGITSEELIGTNYLTRLVPAAREAMAEKLKAVFGGQNASFDIEVESKHFEIHAVPLRDSVGEITRILVVETNITQQKRAATDILKALEKERQLNELKSRFVSMASHEFRTPLSTILTSLSLITKYTNPEQEEMRQKHYNRIRTSIHHLTSILNDFLSLDKLETGLLACNPESLDLRAMLEEHIDEMQSMCKPGQGIELVYEGEVEAHLDRNMFRNIMLNLISNAIKYSPDNGAVEIKAVVLEGKVRIDVRDHGIGIPEADRQHIFERFFRANNATNIQGTGLGLNIVKKYLDLMNGDIWFESEPGKGTVFSIVLPQKLAL